VTAKPAALLLLAGHIVFSLLPALTEIRSDFANYYVPARAWREGQSLAGIYERDAFLSEARRQGISTLGSFVPQPPANALLLGPVARLSPAAAKAVWTLVMTLCLMGAFVALRQTLALSPWLLALVFLVPTASLRNALLYGQPYPLLLLFLSVSLLAETRGRSLLAGLLLSPLVVLKLYGLPFLLGALVTRRWRVALGLMGGAAGLTMLTVLLLGWPVHQSYAQQVLPAAMEGRIQDPYSPIWQSGSSLAHRLFQEEPDLNPTPLLDDRSLLRFALRAFPAVVLLAAVAALGGRRGGADPAGDWAVLTLAALAVSPLASTYHFVMLILPAAVLASRASPRGQALVVGLLAFATSPLPHYFARFASGLGNLLAYPRLAAVLILLAIALRPGLTWRRLGWAAAAGAIAGLTALPAPPEEPWRRIDEARGYLMAAPAVCEGRLTWVTLRGDHLVRSRGSACATEPVSPDGRWLAGSEWDGRSWNIVAVDRASGQRVAVTRDPANELEPAWLSDQEIVFASDRRRGLGATALFAVPFAGAGAASGSTRQPAPD